MEKKRTFILAALLMLLIICLSGCRCLNHSLEKRIIKKPTCSEDGFIEKYCTKCDYSVKEPISCSEELQFESTKKECTCTENGIAIYKCSQCGETEEHIIRAHHSFVNRVCTMCGEIEPLPELSIGMTKTQVKSKWGEPIKIDKSTSSRGTVETWWYVNDGQKIAINFDVDGKVWSINDI